MILYRISNHADLSGKGAEMASARWHTRSPGKRMVYLGDHPAFCVLETLAQTEREVKMPIDFNLLSVDIPDNRIATIDKGRLPDDWSREIARTQEIGDAWLTDGEGLALLVPSVLVPIAHNCLLNPLAPGASELHLELLGRFPLDLRILRPRI